MVEETNGSAMMDDARSVEQSPRSAEPVIKLAVAEAKPAEGDIIATSGVDEVPKSNSAREEPAAKGEVTADAQPEAEAANANTDAAPTAEAFTDATATNGTAATTKANIGRRKSAAGISESKKKTPGKGKKKAPELRLNVSAGEMYMVAMRGYQPWPVIICDEEMLPESLLSKRPVSAKRIDGTYREDFLEGGKNAKDRRYPVMFLGTNEFAWQPNTELLNFDLDDVKKEVEAGIQTKKTKALWDAYQIAAEGHDLAYFKEVLAAHETAMQVDAEQRELKDQEKKEKAERSAKRKSLAADSEDVEMEDVGGDGTTPAAKKAKATKKRKKDDGTVGENEKPAKTPKTKLKLTTKTSKEASAAKSKKETKSKKRSSEEAEPAQPEEPPMTEQERLQKREKQVLYLRHRLQKGFLTRDQAPKDEDMAAMSDYLKQLEAHEDLEAEVIKKTKVHKVLKAIIKLNSIPKEEEHAFKRRSNDLLAKWGGALAADPESAAAVAPSEPTTNGIQHDKSETKPELTKEESLNEVKDQLKQDETPTGAVGPSKPTNVDGDYTMSDVENPTTKDEPATKAEAETHVEPLAKVDIAAAEDVATS